MMFVHHSPLSQIDVVALLRIWHGSKMTGPCWIQQNENRSFEVPLEEPLTISATGSPGQSFYTYQFPLEMPLHTKLKVWAGMLVKRIQQQIPWNSALSSCKNCLGAWFCSRNFQAANVQDQSLRPENLSTKEVLHFAAFQLVQLGSLAPRAQVAHPAWHLKKDIVILVCRVDDLLKEDVRSMGWTTFHKS